MNQHTALFEVVFRDFDDEEVVVQEKFTSPEDAEMWAESMEFEFDDIVFDEEGNDTWRTFYRYYNPETKQNTYTGYFVRPVEPITDFLPPKP